MQASNAVQKVKEYGLSTDDANVPIPIESITELALYGQIPEFGISLITMDYPTVGLRALLKLFGIRDLSEKLCELKKSDIVEPKKMSETKQKAISGLLYVFQGMVSRTCQGCEYFLVKDTRLLPWMVKLLRQVKSDFCKPFIYSTISEFAVHSKGLKLLKTLDAHKLLYEGVSLQCVTYWEASFVTKTLKKKTGLWCQFMCGAMVFFLCEPSMREDLLRLGIEATVKRLLSKLDLRSNIKAYALLSAVEEAILDDKFDQVVRRSRKMCGDPEASIVSCTFCDKKSSVDCKMKRCGACKAVQYCGRECQLADWKLGHKDQCKKLAARKK